MGVETERVAPPNKLFRFHSVKELAEYLWDRTEEKRRKRLRRRLGELSQDPHLIDRLEKIDDFDLRFYAGMWQLAEDVSEKEKEETFEVIYKNYKARMELLRWGGLLVGLFGKTAPLTAWLISGGDLGALALFSIRNSYIWTVGNQMFIKQDELGDRDEELIIKFRELLNLAELKSYINPENRLPKDEVVVGLCKSRYPQELWGSWQEAAIVIAPLIAFLVNHEVANLWVPVASVLSIVLFKAIMKFVFGLKTFQETDENDKDRRNRKILLSSVSFQEALQLLGKLFNNRFPANWGAPIVLTSMMASSEVSVALTKIRKPDDDEVYRNVGKFLADVLRNRQDGRVFRSREEKLGDLIDGLRKCGLELMAEILESFKDGKAPIELIEQFLLRDRVRLAMELGLLESVGMDGNVNSKIWRAMVNGWPISEIRKFNQVANGLSQKDGKVMISVFIPLMLRSTELDLELNRLRMLGQETEEQLAIRQIELSLIDSKLDLVDGGLTDVEAGLENNSGSDDRVRKALAVKRTYLDLKGAVELAGELEKRLLELGAKKKAGKTLTEAEKEEVRKIFKQIDELSEFLKKINQSG